MQSDRQYPGWRIVAICFLSFNCAVGLSAGSFGVVLLNLQAEFGITRATASSPLGLFYMSFGLVAPVVGKLVQHIAIRKLMLSGALLSSAGYGLLAFAPNFSIVLLICVLALGPGACLLATVPVATLLARWFNEGRGRALGFATTPILILIVPPIAAGLVLHGGRQLLFLTIALVFTLLMPLIACLKEAPNEGKEEAAPQTMPSLGRSAWSFLALPSFWVVSLALGVMGGMGVVISTHAIPITTSRALPIESGALLLSIFGGSTMAGGIIFGWLADRIGAITALAINLAIHGFLWFAMLGAMSMPVLMVIMSLMGVCMGATAALHGAVISRICGLGNLGTAMGFSYLLKTPFYLLLAPITGYLYDISGSYRGGLLTNGALLVTCALLCTWLILPRRGSTGLSDMPAA